LQRQNEEARQGLIQMKGMRRFAGKRSLHRRNRSLIGGAAFERFSGRWKHLARKMQQNMGP
jgi:hypothetical protein